MALIQKNQVADMFHPTIYRRGREYYFQGRVGKLNFEHGSGICRTYVEGTHSYLVEVNVSKLPENVAVYCDCPAFEQYYECKHIVAAMLEICEKQDELLQARGRSYDRYHAAADLLQLLDGGTSVQQIIPSFGKKRLKIEYHCDFSNPQALFAELRAGVDHAYVVRDVGEFIEHIKGGQEHPFTKKFTYSPEEHEIDPADMAILDELYLIIENEKLYAEGIKSYYVNPSIYSTSRSVMIPPLFARPLLEKWTDRHAVGKLGSRTFAGIRIIEEEFPFQYELGKNKENDLELLLPNIENAVYMGPYDLVFLNGDIYFPQPDLLPFIEKILKIQTKNSKISIAKDQADAFVSEVLPRLEKLGTVRVAEKVKEQIIQVPLTAKAYIDLDGDTIKAKLEYDYGGLTVDPFYQHEEPGKILIRDVEKEKEIMTIIENAGMKYNGKELHLQLEEEELYEFLFFILPALGERCELFLTNNIRRIVSLEQPVPKTNVETEESAGLLEISFQLEGIDDEEIADIMRTAIEKKRFYRMRNGAFLSLETDEFQSLQELFTDLRVSKEELEEGSVHVPIFRGVQIDEALRTKKQYDPAFKRLLDHLKKPEEQIYPLPEGLKASMREYQKTGYQWFRSLSEYHLGGILADDMGLGKTLQSIAYLLSEQEGNRHLIVAPASLIYNWQSEWNKFAPSVRAVVVSGTREEREKALALQDADVYITSYSTLRQDIDLYKNEQFHTLILDEAQFIKNYTTKSAAAVRSIRASRKFALSGTPIENSVDELWGIFQAIMPGLFPGLKDFKKLEPEKISQIIKPFILRRLKTDVLKELPEKIESTHITELSKEQKELYLGYLQRIQEETAASLQGEGFQKSRMKILAGITRLRQLCCHPSLFLENYEGKSGKLEQLMETVEASIENGKKLLIFSQFTSMLEIIQQELVKAGYPHFYLNGQTPSQERLRMSEQFNNGEKAIFLISLKAGGTGLNLTAADTVILYDLWWNPAVEDQAAGRAHRFGQKNVVQVIRLITKGTIEEKIYQLQQKKRELIEQVIQPGETMLSSLTEDDIKEILSM
ncbi:SNF2 helicase associated domain-containing protein [Siminovitchia fortis]|uniref:Helicase SNF2 n=1 Tax=Siminovitchia fortis TaxID=254758 RepID=A0A443IN83_9BACI|nr:DEAD/DEAH box helicase [Siminovitchia fortis]RWR07512.1 helicase SNF2 [Siminovitchia fortis]WHY81593.1 SNF2 helicase associated domain-containing protein [Siminovitchia fortis]